jgi:hypothetical protein
MSVRIICINKDSGNHENRHTAISYLGWTEESTGKGGKISRDDMYKFITEEGGSAYVKDSRGDIAYLIGAKTARGTKYVKTVADETKADNLLTLPECRV